MSFDPPPQLPSHRYCFQFSTLTVFLYKVMCSLCCKKISNFPRQQSNRETTIIDIPLPPGINFKSSILTLKAIFFTGILFQVVSISAGLRCLLFTTSWLSRSSVSYSEPSGLPQPPTCGRHAAQSHTWH